MSALGKLNLKVCRTTSFAAFCKDLCPHYTPPNNRKPLNVFFLCTSQLKSNKTVDHIEHLYKSWTDTSPLLTAKTHSLVVICGKLSSFFGFVFSDHYAENNTVVGSDVLVATIRAWKFPRGLLKIKPVVISLFPKVCSFWVTPLH